MVRVVALSAESLTAAAVTPWHQVFALRTGAIGIRNVACRALLACQIVVLEAAQLAELSKTTLVTPRAVVVYQE